MKKYLVIGNPIDHSLSPKLHNYWFKKNNIDAAYEKKLLNEVDIKDTISKVKKELIHGVNVTVPYKKPLFLLLMNLVQKQVLQNQLIQFIRKIIKLLVTILILQGLSLALDIFNMM